MEVRFRPRTIRTEKDLAKTAHLNVIVTAVNLSPSPYEMHPGSGVRTDRKAPGRSPAPGRSRIGRDSLSPFAPSVLSWPSTCVARSPHRSEVGGSTPMPGRVTSSQLVWFLAIWLAGFASGAPAGSPTPVVVGTDPEAALEKALDLRAGTTGPAPLRPMRPPSKSGLGGPIFATACAFANRTTSSRGATRTRASECPV